MEQLFIAAAIPFFFLLMGLELWWKHRRGERHYRFADSITNLSCGVGQQVVSALCAGAIILPYTLIYDHLRLWTLAPTTTLGQVLAWVGVILGVDLGYYAFHRAAHRVNFLWALHAVHHQSEEYNLSVALRQTWFGGLFSWFFYLPLAFLGVPPGFYLAALAIDTLYQFWIHLRGVPALGALERVLNTPSHHRVHHGIDPRYIDKNYAGIFIIWDRLFGTFTPEAGEPVYGTVKPLASWNPLWANVVLWGQLAELSRSCRRWRDRVFVWFAPPEWRPPELGGRVTIPEVSRASQVLYDRQPPPSVGSYVAAHYVLISVATFLFLLHGKTLPPMQFWLWGAAIVAAVSTCGALLEGARHAPLLEILRLLGAAALLGWLVSPRAALVGVAVAVASVLWLLPNAKAYKLRTSS